MKKYLNIMMLLLILIPFYVYAGGSSDDRVYSTTYEDGYTYGNVKDCLTSSGIAWFEGIETASGYKVCLWNTKDKVGTDKFKCEDSEMERFTLGKVTDNNGTEYWGYGCRKANPEKIEYIKRTLEVGYGEQLAYQYSNTCTILEGDAIEFNKHNGCWIDAIKAGSAKVKVVNKDNQTVSYYEYEVKSPTVSVTELDENYYYGNIDKCHLGSKGYSYGGTVKLNGYTFCGSSAAGYNFESYEVSCKEDGYDTFQLTFTADDGGTYKGYGCRKIKNEENIEYVKKQIYAGYGVQLAYEHSHKCTIISGTAGKFNEWNACYFDAIEPGVVRIKVVSETTGMATYYEYEILEPLDSVTELDDKYYYGNVDECHLGEKGYTYGSKVKFNNYNFCGSKAAGYNYEKYSVTCENPKYETFTLTFSSDEGVTYKGYGCRCLKTSDCNNSGDISITPVDPEALDCNSLLGNPDIQGQPAFYLQIVFDVMKYVAIIIVIVFSILDFTGAVASQDNDILKKSVKKLMIRLILCVVIFVLPTILEFVFTLINVYSPSTCGIN